VITEKFHSVAEMTPELANHVIIPEHAWDGRITAALAGVAGEIASPAGGSRIWFSAIR
jgi:hypothetical protein